MKIFISYAAEDSVAAKRIAAVLQSAEVEHFLDQKAIHAGDGIHEKVVKGIRDCTHLLVVLSPASLASQWVPYEVGLAKGNRRVIIPYLAHISVKAPAFLSDTRSISSTRELKEYLALPESDRSVRDEDDKPLGDKFVDSDMAEFYQRAKRELLDLFAEDPPSIFLSAAASWIGRMERDLGDEEERVESGMAKVRQEAESKDLTEAEKQAHAITAFMWITTTAGRAKKQELLQQLRHLLTLARAGGGDMDDTVIAQKVVRLLSRERVAAPNPVGRTDG